MQRYATFAIPLGPRDLDTVQAASAHDLDALRAQTHRVLHRAFHRTTEHDPFFELLGNRVGDQLRIDFRFADFFDVHVNGVDAQQFAQFGLEDFNVLALLADDHTRACAVNRDTRILSRTLDDDASDGGVPQLGSQVIADLQ